MRVNRSVLMAACVGLVSAMVVASYADEAATPATAASDARATAPDAAAAPDASADASTAPKSGMSESELVGYGIGLGQGRQIKEMLDQNKTMLEELGLTFDVAAFKRGLLAALEGLEPAAGDEEIQAALFSFQMQAMAKQNEKAAADAAKNLADGNAYLEANRAKPGVTVTESGLQIETLRKGEGASPKSGEVVKVQYKGTFINGETFDSSYDRSEPAEFEVDGVIPGFSEGLKLMSVGGMSRLVIPANIAYGEQGNRRIPPNSVLVFQVELLEVRQPEAAPAPVEPAPAGTE